jgi:hypothetical protein
LVAGATATEPRAYVLLFFQAPFAVLLGGFKTWLLPFDSGLPIDGGCLKRPVAVFSATDRSTSELDVRRPR